MNLKFVFRELYQLMKWIDNCLCEIIPFANRSPCLFRKGALLPASLCKDSVNTETSNYVSLSFLCNFVTTKCLWVDRQLRKSLSCVYWQLICKLTAELKVNLMLIAVERYLETTSMDDNCGAIGISSVQPYKLRWSVSGLQRH